MNPRVKELAEKAGGVVLAGSEIQKFAELIVWECMKICEDVMKKDNSALACWSAIKGTFRS